jgi:hypothetical protein
MKQLCLLFVFGYAISGGVAHAATYYTSTSGDDGNSCDQAQSPSSTKLTINGALACLTAGDTLYVGGGTYYEEIRTAPSGTSWDNSVRIAANPGETVWLAPFDQYVLYLAWNEQYIEFDGINMDSSYAQYGNVTIQGWNAAVGNPNHIRIQNAELIGGPYGNQILATASVPGIIGGNEFINLTIHGGASFGFYIGSSNNLVDSCNIYDVAGAGLQIYNGYGSFSDNNIIRNNTIHDITRSNNGIIWGIITGSGSGNQVYNNTIYNLGLNSDGNAGIIVYSGSATEVSNNTVYGTGGFGFYVAPEASATDVVNSVAFGNLRGPFIDMGTGTTSANNSFAP